MRRRFFGVVLALALLTGAGCSADEPGDVSAGEPLEVVVIGDVASLGADGRPGWPEELGRGLEAEVRSDVVEGSGYLSATPGSLRDRAALVDSRADVVIVALGSQDVDRAVPEDARARVVRDGLSAVAERGAPVVVLPPLVPTGSQEAPAAQWRATVEEVAGDLGLLYLDIELTRGAGMVQSDGRLGAEAATLVAERVARALSG